MPSSNASVDWECGTYFSDISMENMEDYLQALVDEGWKHIQGNTISSEITVGTSNYMLTNGTDILQMMIFLRDKEVAICNSILIKLDVNLSISKINNRKDAISNSEALDKIQLQVDEMLKQGTIPYTKGLITGLFEIYIEDAYDKLQSQAYAAISDNGFAGCFLIRKGIVSAVKGNLSNACIVDIDEDENYELVDLFTTWGAGIYKIELVAYEYRTPSFLSSNIIQLLQCEYYNCFVPESGYEELYLTKVNDTTIKLVGETVDYGKIKAKGTTLFLDNMEGFPFEEWAVSYDQNQLLVVDKDIPLTPPEIIISIDGLSLNYVVSPSNWGKEENEFATGNALAEIMKSDSFIPTFGLANRSIVETYKSVMINFGNSIPDSIKVYDAMLDDQGGVRYGDKLIMEQTVKILDGRRVSFDLKQHIANGLSSFLGDYEKDWRRLFRVVCKWGDKECVYAFLINTGIVETLTEIPDNQLIDCDGSFSKVSSSWGLGLSIDGTNLPKRYVIEWQVSDGSLRKWSELGTKPMNITEQHNGYPMTFSDDNNKGAVIWAPLSFDTEEDVIVKAYVYEEDADKSPIAYSKILLENRAGVFQKNSIAGSLFGNKYSPYTKAYIWSLN
jgi:L-fucose mutarotase/ribose pyranase (RbsD/FucU family)